MLLAGDIGGTSTRLGLFDSDPVRPRPIVVRVFETLAYADLTTMIAELIDRGAGRAVDASSIESACFGVAGPVMGDTATLTNVPWTIDAQQVKSRFNFKRAHLLNDLAAMAYAVPVLEESEVHVLQQGHALPGGNVALIAAGTGLGEALLHYVDDRLVPSASEGGHADFAARTEREIVVVRELTQRFGRVEVERVISGRGLLNIQQVTHSHGPCEIVTDLDDVEAPAAISTCALERRCARCVETLDIFVDAYGAEAGNLALRSVSTGGVYIGGGIAPKILPALTTGAFMTAFRDKAPLQSLVEAMPVKVILNAEAGLLGAAVFASMLLNRR